MATEGTKKVTQKHFGSRSAIFHLHNQEVLTSQSVLRLGFFRELHFTALVSVYVLK
jgi:hypothetical protein